nr:restriction endonuclease subunit S [uncultured Prevotella sp.]
MKEEWEYKKLGEVASYINGFAFKPSQWSDTGTPIVRIQNLNNPEASYNYYDGVLPDKVKIKKGDLLISWSASLGAYLWMGDEAYLNQHIFKVQFDKLDIDKMFLKYAVSSKLDVMANLVHGATMKHIVKSDFDKTRIPYPPKPTQLSIVSELDKLNELIQIKKEQLNDYDALAQSIFYEMFGDPVENEKGWEVKKLGEIGTLERGAGISKKDFVDDGLPCIHYGQLHTTFGAYTRKNITFIPKDLLPKYKIAHSGDLILAITSEDVEGSCKSTAWLGGYDVVIGSDAAIFHHNQNGIYLSYYTRTKAFYNEKAKYAKGFKVTHISTKEIASISICVPPLSIQNIFANKIEQIEKQKAIIQKIIMDLESLLASRMQYWFD